MEAAQREHEAAFFAMMPAVDRAATELMGTDQALARRFLTDWSVGAGEHGTRSPR